MKKLLSLILVIALAVGCIAMAEDVVYERADDEEVYLAVLGEYYELCEAAKAAADDNERFVLYAQAEAALLDSAVMIPTTTQNGAYTINRIAPRTVPYVQWGNDDDRLKGLVISGDDFLTPAERADLFELWAAACKGEGEYDPAAYLTSKGHSINRNYKTTFSTAPVTLDWLNTSSQSDTEITVNCVDGLVEYNNLSQLCPALATEWTVSEDGTVYTFTLRQDANWYTSEGAVYAPVTAHDFEAGFHHMLDTEAGLEWLVTDAGAEVVGVADYLYNGGSYDAVGYKATGDYELTITLARPYSYFMTMLTYSLFLPICEDWYLSHGGVYGKKEYQKAFASDSYTFGKSTDVASQVYNGPFLIQKLNADSEIDLVANPGYYKADEVNLDTITWIYDNGENPTQYYNDVCAGIYAGSGLAEASGTLALAKADGNFDKYCYISETTSTTYFGGLNVNRGTFALASGACASTKTEQQKIDTETAMMNINFRKAVMKAFDKETYNAVTRGTDLALTNLRNMYTYPEFVTLTADVTDADGKTFVAGTFYCEMVQHYLDLRGANIIVKDGVNGWYDPEGAKECLAKAIEELGDTVTWPIGIDVVYYSANANQTAQAQAYKQCTEDVLGAEYVTVNLIEATNSADFYASGYRATSGVAGNFDMFYGSGWGPDFGDPITYLATMTYGGYMTKVIGID